jgi:hypothetical protein
MCVCVTYIFCNVSVLHRLVRHVAFSTRRTRDACVHGCVRWEKRCGGAVVSVRGRALPSTILCCGTLHIHSERRAECVSSLFISRQAQVTHTTLTWVDSPNNATDELGQNKPHRRSLTSCVHSTTTTTHHHTPRVCPGDVCSVVDSLFFRWQDHKRPTFEPL